MIGERGSVDDRNTSRQVGSMLAVTPSARAAQRIVDPAGPTGVCSVDTAEMARYHAADTTHAPKRAIAGAVGVTEAPARTEACISDRGMSHPPETARCN